MVQKRLYRNVNERIIGGVCAGIADYLDVDPTLIRIIWAFGTLLWGAGILAYLVLWIIVPEKPLKKSKSRSGSPEARSAGRKKAKKK